MLRCSARPYEGREKYIFVSYSHRDRELVYPIIEKMTADGYRIWYDEGVAPDSEWPEYIAAHLDGSYTCLAMVSANSMRSQNCRREINFALSREKPLTVVYLEDTQIPLGMEMQLSVTQPVYKYLFEEDTDFYNKLYCAESLNETFAVEPSTSSSVSTDGTTWIGS